MINNCPHLGVSFFLAQWLNEVTFQEGGDPLCFKDLLGI